MKKNVLGVVIALSLALILAACGDDLEERVFEAEQMGVESTLTYYHDDDEVVKQTAENVITYADLGLGSKEEAQELLNPQAEQYKDVDGVEHEIDYGDEQATESLEVDYDNLDYEKAQNIDGITVDGNGEKSNISMEKSAEMLEQQGFTENE